MTTTGDAEHGERPGPPGGGGPAPYEERAVDLRDKRRLGLAAFGDPDGFTVFWFHGTPGARRQVPPAAIEFAGANGLRLVGLERPGVGWSTAHLYRHMADWADDVAQVADVVGADRFGVVGLSGGGPYVLACAAKLPERVVAAAVLGGVAPTRGRDAADGGLVALTRPFEPVLATLRWPLSTALDLTIRNVLTPVADQAADLYTRFGPASDRAVLSRPEMRATLIGDLLNASGDQFKAIVDDVVLFGRHWGFDLGEIEVPVYFWHGDADAFVPLAHGERMAAAVRNGVLNFRPGDGHLATLDAGRDALELILGQARAGE